MFPVMEQLKSVYGDDLRVIYRHLPLITIHDKAQITAEAAEAAGAQDKFWEMHDILFREQPNWADAPEAEMVDILVGFAEDIGVPDVDQFRDDLENDTYADEILDQYQTAVDANLASTPTFIVNQVDYPVRDFGLSFQGLDLFMQLMRLREGWYSQPEQVIEAGKEYIATIQTEKGDIVMELYPDTAPVNVNSFVFLAQNGWYKDVTFHRVLDGFVAQAGDPTGTGIGFPGYRCGDELHPSRTFDKAGVVSLANSGPNSNGSQFFITYAATPQLGPNFTIIGQVIEGMDIANTLSRRDPRENSNAPPGDKVIDIIIEEKS